MKLHSQIENIISSLINTSDDIEAVCISLDIEYNDLKPEDFTFINKRIFKCETCGIWNLDSDKSIDQESCVSCFEDIDTEDDY